MKDSLAPGIELERTIKTTPEMGVSHLGEGPGVFSTPSMIGQMEQTCLKCAEDHLDEGEQTVGTMVHIWHRAALPIGEEVTLRCKLLERKGRALLFEVEAVAGDKKIGDGTHERYVIDTKRFGG